MVAVGTTLSTGTRLNSPFVKGGPVKSLVSLLVRLNALRFDRGAS